jgi:hypothetical protein
MGWTQFPSEVPCVVSGERAVTILRILAYAYWYSWIILFGFIAAPLYYVAFRIRDCFKERRT